MKKGTHHTEEARDKIAEAIRAAHRDGAYEGVTARLWKGKAGKKRREEQSRRAKRWWRAVRAGKIPAPKHVITGRWSKR